MKQKGGITWHITDGERIALKIQALGYPAEVLKYLDALEQRDNQRTSPARGESPQTDDRSSPQS